MFIQAELLKAYYQGRAICITFVTTQHLPCQPVNMLPFVLFDVYQNCSFSHFLNHVQKSPLDVFISGLPLRLWCITKLSNTIV